VYRQFAELSHKLAIQGSPQQSTDIVKLKHPAVARSAHQLKPNREL
jgi:hypothetical protein